MERTTIRRSWLTATVALLLVAVASATTSRAEDKKTLAARRADFAARVKQKQAEGQAQLAKRKIEIRTQVVRRDATGQTKRIDLDPRLVSDGAAASFVHDGGKMQVTRVGRGFLTGADSLEAEVGFHVCYSENLDAEDLGMMIEVKPLFVPREGLPRFAPADGFQVEITLGVRRAVEPKTAEAQVITGSLTSGIYRVHAEEVIKVVAEKDAQGEPLEWIEVSVREKK